MTTRKTMRGPRIDVNVTAEIMLDPKTLRANSSHCMIAEAIKVAYPNATGVAVDLATCRFSDREKRLRYVFLTPRVAQQALIEFDEGTMPAPFRFRLRKPHITNMTATTKQPQTDESANQRELLSKTTLVTDKKHPTTVPLRVGGRRPPQLHLRREFGIRAFRGAGVNHLAGAQSNGAEST